MREQSRTGQEGRYNRIAYLFAIVNIAIFFGCFLNQNIWYDETYSMAILNHSWKELWSITVTDVHPPLYFYISKLAASVLGNTIWVGRLVSFLPFAGIIVLGMTRIRRLFGDKVMAFYLMFSSAMPVMLRLELEIRMYTWAMFFVTFAGIYAYEVYADGRICKWIGMTIAGLLAAYTHYYALLSIAVLYTALLILILIDKRYEDKKKFVCSWLLSVLVDCIIYLPWLWNLLNQVRVVESGFWIDKPGLYELATYVIYSFHIVEKIPPTLCAGVLLLPVLIIILLHIRKTEDAKRRFAILYVVTFVGIIVIGVVVSYLLTPVFVARYMSPAMGLLWLAFALVLDSVDKKKGRVVVILLGVLFLLEGVYQVRYEWKPEGQKLISYLETHLTEDDKLLVSDNHSLGLAWYYGREYCSIYRGYGSETLPAFEGEVNYVKRMSEVPENGELWYLITDTGKKWKQLKGQELVEQQRFTSEGFDYILYKVE